jgi:N-acetylglucosaminyldiphosphoundecaprenol N-acetyl-beta-D-mannosaminyltransferase
MEVVIASHRDGRWLEPCLNSLESAAGACAYRATIVENGGSPVPLPETPTRRVIYMQNLGFAAANNAGSRGSAADLLLFLNPDTEVAQGTLELLVKSMRNRPDVGLLAVRQVTSDGSLWPSLHRFPSLRRALAQALASEKWPGVGGRVGERVLDSDRYSRGGPFDWTTGAVLAVRREAFEAIGGFDERFFLFSEETDLCKRIQDVGWEAHLEPGVTFVHHAGKAGVDPPREAQMAYARLQYAKKHFSRPGVAAYHAILLLHHLLRFVILRFRGSTRSSSAPASVLALSVLLGRTEPPFRRAEPAAWGPVPPPAQETASIMGMPLHKLDHPTLIQTFLQGVRAGKGGWIVTPNLDILRQFTTSHESRELIMAASHRVADGLPLVWASRLAGSPIPERVAGSDLVLSMPEAAARAGLSVFLLGGDPGAAAAAAARLEDLCPGLQGVDSYCPPYGFEDDPAELERIKEALHRARPALVLIGLGFPKQEQLINLLRSEMPQTWFVGIGISLSFLAGKQPRAPAALQRLGLEWVHRLWHEPRRLFRRYVVLGIPFAVRLFAWAMAHRLRGAHLGDSPRDQVGGRPSRWER